MRHRATPRAMRARARASTSTPGARSNARARRGAARGARASARRDDDDDATSALRRLGLDARDASTLTETDVRRAYRAAMRDAHPDAPRGSTSRALATRAAYEAATRALTEGTLADAADDDDDDDAFGARTLARAFDGARHGFVNAPRCAGEAACASSCVKAAPRSFETDARTGKARWIERDDFADASAEDVSALAYAEWCASQRCPERCIAFVTARQRAFMLEALESDDGAGTSGRRAPSERVDRDRRVRQRTRGGSTSRGIDGRLALGVASKRVGEIDAVPAHRPRVVFALAQPTRVAGFKLAPERVAAIDPRALALPARLPARAADTPDTAPSRAGSARRDASTRESSAVAKSVGTVFARAGRDARANDDAADAADDGDARVDAARVDGTTTRMARRAG